MIDHLYAQNAEKNIPVFEETFGPRPGAFVGAVAIAQT